MTANGLFFIKEHVEFWILRDGKFGENPLNLGKWFTKSPNSYPKLRSGEVHINLSALYQAHQMWIKEEGEAIQIKKYYFEI